MTVGIPISELVALIVAITPIVVALIAVSNQVRQTHDLVNSRMTELLELTRTAARAEGKLDQQ